LGEIIYRKVKSGAVAKKEFQRRPNCAVKIKSERNRKEIYVGGMRSRYGGVPWHTPEEGGHTSEREGLRGGVPGQKKTLMLLGRVGVHVPCFPGGPLEGNHQTIKGPRGEKVARGDTGF